MKNFKVVSAFKFIDLNLWYQPIHFWIFEAQYVETLWAQVPSNSQLTHFDLVFVT